MAWWQIAGAALGALAGSQASQESQTQSRRMGPAGQLEQEAARAAGGFGQLEEIQRGQLGSEATAASNSFADLLRQYQQSGGLPSQADFAAAQTYAQQATAPQQQQIDLAMRQAQQAAAQQAGLMGRRGNDFALQTRLGQQRNDAMAVLGAQQAAMGAQYAQQLSQNRLGYAGQLADVRQGLMQQAMQNRMAIMGLGSNILNQQQQFRASTADVTSGRSSGGGLMGALTGGIMGAGMGTNLMKFFGGAGDSAANVAGAAGFTMPQLGSSAVGGAPAYSLGANFGGGGGAASSGTFSAPIAAAPTSMGSNPFPAFASAANAGGATTPWSFNALSPGVVGGGGGMGTNFSAPASMFIKSGGY